MQLHTPEFISKNISNFDAWNLYGNFLDDFYRSSQDERQSLIVSEPLFSSENQIFYATLAAAIERLCNLYSLDKPSWIEKSEYFLNEPYYAFNTKSVEYQKFLRRTTFEEYSRRNLFYGENVLKRA